VFFDSACNFGDPPPDCGTTVAGGQRRIAGQVFWQAEFPGSVTVTDSCAGPQPDIIADVFGTPFFETWTVPGTPGPCTTTLRATNLFGVSTEVAARYTIVAP
jgi:hypothetical protein